MPLAVAELFFEPRLEIVGEPSEEPQAAEAELRWSNIDAAGLQGEIDEAPFIELPHSHVCGLPGEPEEPSQFGDVHLPIHVDRFESSVLSE
jgi:hypothetical protein